MLTFSLNLSTGNNYAHRVLEAIKQNEGYFKKFNNALYEEAMHKAYICALEHKKEGYTDLAPYIKKLARTILKVRETESPFDVYNEDGEVSAIFSKLQDTIDESHLVEKEEIKDIFREMYLVDKDEFMKLQNLFGEHVNEDAMKQVALKNVQLKNILNRTYKAYGGQLVFYVLMEFFNDLAMYTTNEEPKIREINLRGGNYSVIDKIPDTPCIKTLADGEPHCIDKNTLKMKINPDLTKWDTISNTNCNIIKVDISPLVNYMYEQIFVEEGVNTKHIEWCGSKYKLITPGGYSVIGMERVKFMATVHTELILNLLMNNFNKIIAISEDSVYIKPTRVSNLETIRLKTVQGKIIDLPVTTHIKKRRVI